MIFLFVFLAFICLWNIRVPKFHDDYMSLEATTSIKGIFAVIILYSHLSGYIQLSNNWYDQSFKLVLNYIGQLMVSMYFFYSSYGIMESLKTKRGYVKSFFKNRIIKILVHFDIAVLAYLILAFLMGKEYPLSYYFTCWVGWDSIGNSNWFIFVILFLYLLLYVTLLITRRLDNKMVWDALIMTILSVLFMLVLKIAGKSFYWYDTILTFPLGMWFSLFRNGITSFFKKVHSRVVSSVIVLFIVSAVFVTWYYYFRIDNYSICACLFSLLVVFVCMKIKIGNGVLHWLGVCSFDIYILQRIPMNLLQMWGVSNRYVFAILAISFALLISWLFHLLLKKIDTVLFPKIV